MQAELIADRLVHVALGRRIRILGLVKRLLNNLAIAPQFEQPGGVLEHLRGDNRVAGDSIARYER